DRRGEPEWSALRVLCDVRGLSGILSRALTGSVQHLQQQYGHQSASEYFKGGRLQYLRLPAEPALDTVRRILCCVAQRRIGRHEQRAAGVRPGLVDPSCAVLAEENARPVGRGLLSPRLCRVPALTLQTGLVDLHAGLTRGLDDERGLMRPDLHRHATAMAASL